MSLASTPTGTSILPAEPTKPRRRRALRDPHGTSSALATGSAGTELTFRKETLSDHDIQQAATRICRIAAYPQLELAVFYLMLSTGARPLELARMRTRDVLTEDGTIRHRTQYAPFLPDSDASARPVFLECAAVRRALSVYATFRYRAGHGTTDTAGFRGLDPDSPFFADPQGNPYEIEITAGIQRDRHKCCGMLRTCRLVFRHARVPGICVAALRRTLAVRLRSQAASLDEICAALGLKDRREARALLDEPDPVVKRRSLSEYFQNIVPDSYPDSSDDESYETEEA